MNRIQIQRARKSTPYEADYAQWCAEQGALLREGRLADLDRDNLAEEIESLGRSDKREISKRLGKLLIHLLKWEFQAAKRKRGWLLTIREQRYQLTKLLKDSPSLKGLPAAELSSEYGFAREKAALATGLPVGLFPVDCPYRIEDVLNFDFLPGAAWHRI